VDDPLYDANDEQLDEQALVRTVMSKALALLALREHGDKELAFKLSQKCSLASDEVIAAVIQTCQQNNWQSDDRYIERYVASAIEKGQGPLKIRHVLNSKTSRDELIDGYLAMEEDEWVQIAHQVLLKKYGEPETKLPSKEQAKQMRFLASRGFSQNQIWKAFR